MSSSVPLGLLPVCSGSVSFLRHRLPVLSCFSFFPLLVDSPPPAFLGLLAFASFVGFAFPVIPSLAPPCLSPLVFAFCMLQFGIILVVPLSVLSSYCVYSCLFPFFLHVFLPAVVLTVPSFFSPLFGLLCLFLFFGGLPSFPHPTPPPALPFCRASGCLPCCGFFGCPRLSGSCFPCFLLVFFRLISRSASFLFLIPRAVLSWCLFLLVLVVVLCAPALVLSPPFLPCYVAVASVSLFSDSFESPVPVATWSLF